LFMETPDDTIAPADNDTSADLVARLDVPIPHITAEWQHFTSLLSKAGVGGGSAANFQTYFNKLSDVHTQWQIENAASAGDWSYDADNMLVIDNFKVERLYEGLADITYTVAGDQLTLNWTAASTGETHLQSASTVDGPFQDVAAAQSPYTVPAASGNSFFRLSWTQP
jgi:hypothetical protein